MSMSPTGVLVTESENMSPSCAAFSISNTGMYFRLPNAKCIFSGVLNIHCLIS